MSCQCVSTFSHTCQEDKDHIRRVVNLEQILKQEQLNMEGAVKILQLYYTVGDTGDLEPIPKSSDKMFQKELLTASSKVFIAFRSWVNRGIRAHRNVT